jgi:hypothetical protein
VGFNREDEAFMPRTLRTGKLPAQPARPRLELRPALEPLGLAAPPQQVDYYSEISSIGMLANDDLGDCVPAGMGHVVEQDTEYTTGTEQVVTDAATITVYEQVAGYNPNDPNSDQGTVVQDALDYWRKTGVFPTADGKLHRLAAFAAVKLTDWTEIELATSIFGQVIIGFNFPDSAMDQFNAGQPWTVVKGSPLDGGHCVVLVGYDADWLYVLTWGAVQKMARAFWTAYVDEAWVCITQETINAQGANAYGGIVDLATLGADFASLTNDPNPFPDVPPGPTPAPTPSPTPTPEPTPTPPGPAPTPEPSPVIDDADQALHDATAVRHLLATHSDFMSPHQVSQLRHAVKTWEHDKGFTA